MIKAEELFVRRDAPKEEEIRRLTELQNRIPQEPLSVRIALGRDLLAIIENSKTNVVHRTSAGFKIAAYAKDFNLINSKAASKTLMRVLRTEFFGEGLVFFWEKNKAKPFSPLSFVVMYALINGLIAINSEQGGKALRMAYQEFKQNEYREQLVNLAKIKGLEIGSMK